MVGIGAGRPSRGGDSREREKMKVLYPLGWGDGRTDGRVEKGSLFAGYVYNPRTQEAEAGELK